MKRTSTLFLQSIVVLIGILVLAALLIEPHFEGRNVNATLFAVYFKDPFLAYVYLGSVPFFVALYHAFSVLRLAGSNNVFSQAAVNALRTIKYCAFLTAGAVIAADAFLMINAVPEDDPAGAIMMGLIATFSSIVIGAAAAVFENLLQHAVLMKSETDLTV